MIVYYFLLFIILSSQFLLSTNKITKKTCCILNTIAIIVVLGCASKELGLTDAVAYELAFNRIVNAKSIKELVELNTTAVDQRILQSAYTLGFVFFTKLITVLSTSYEFFLFLSRAAMWIFIGKIIYKYSEYPLISYLLLFSLNLFSGSLYLVRPVLAMIFGVMAIENYIKNKNLKSVVCCFIAMSIHVTGAIFFFIFILGRIKIRAATQFAGILLGVFLSLFGNQIWQVVVSIVAKFIPYYRHYASGHAGSFSNTWIVIVAIQLYYNLRSHGMKCDLFDNSEFDYSDNNKLTNLFVNMTLCVSIFMACQVFMDEFNRLSWYYSFAPAILFTRALRQDKAVIRVPVIMVLIFGLSAYWLYYVLPIYNAVPYIPFWR